MVCVCGGLTLVGVVCSGGGGVTGGGGVMHW